MKTLGDIIVWLRWHFIDIPCFIVYSFINGIIGSIIPLFHYFILIVVPALVIGSLGLLTLVGIAHFIKFIF